MSDEQNEQEKVVVDAEDVREVVRWWERMSEKDKREMSGPAFNLMRKLEKALGEALEARHPKPQWTWEQRRSDRLYLSLKGAREKLCVAQTDVRHDSHRRELQDAIDTIDRLGVFYAPQQWSKYDEPPTPELGTP